VRDKRAAEDVVARVDQPRELTVADGRLSVATLLETLNHSTQWYRPRGRLSPAQIAGDGDDPRNP